MVRRGAEVLVLHVEPGRRGMHRQRHTRERTTFCLLHVCASALQFVHMHIPAHDEEERQRRLLRRKELA